MLMIRRWYSKTNGWFPNNHLWCISPNRIPLSLSSSLTAAQRQLLFFGSQCRCRLWHLAKRRGVNDRCGMVTGDRKRISGKLANNTPMYLSGTNLAILPGELMIVVLSNSSFFILYWGTVPFLLCHVWLWGLWDGLIDLHQCGGWMLAKRK